MNTSFRSNKKFSFFGFSFSALICLVFYFFGLVKPAQAVICNDLLRDSQLTSFESSLGASAVIGCGGTPATPGWFLTPYSDSDGTFTVTWASSFGANYYKLDQKTLTNPIYVNISSPTGTSFTTSNLPNNTYTYRVSACSFLSGCSFPRTSGDVLVNQPPPNTAPTITAIAAQTIEENTDTGNLPFSVSDNESSANSLTVIGKSANTVLVPDANIVISGSGSNRTVNVTPALNSYGTVTITLIVSDGSASKSTSFLLTVNQAPVPIPNGIDPANEPISAPVYNGETTGQFVVGKDGSANYSIPIEVAPGINGIQPKLSLSYNSNRRNGAAGWGWALQGLSRITRCPASLARDGYKSGIAFGEDFQFCLDGQRLVKVASNEYRTEKESFLKIISVGTTGANPTKWTIYQKDGSVYQYGHTSSSTQKEQTRSDFFAWHINQITDVAGNYLVVNYEKNTSTGIHRPEYIEYTKNNSAQNTNQRVDFVYQTRPDKSTIYVAESLSVMDKRLSRINVLSNSNIVRYYELDYQQYGSVYFGKTFQDPVETSRLSSIRMCATASKCAEPIEFDWSNAETGQYAIDPAATITPDVEEHSNELRGDFDGDGIQEIIYLSNNRYYLREHDQVASTSNSVWYDCGTNGCNNWAWKTAGNRAIDMNGDGKDDVITSSWQSRYIFVAYSTGSSFAAPVLLKDLGSDFTTSNLIDLNGDNLPDLFSYASFIAATVAPKYHVAFNNGSGFDQSTVWMQGTSIVNMFLSFADQTNTWSKPQFADFNADGLIDVWTCNIRYGQIDGETEKGCKIVVALNTGSGFSSGVDWSSNELFPRELIFGDINGDGFMDYARITLPDDVMVALSDGDRFLPETNWTQSEKIVGRQSTSSYVGGLKFGGKYTKIAATVLADVNGDRCADIVSFGAQPHSDVTGAPVPQTDWAHGIYVSLSRCGLDADMGMGFTSVVKWYDQEAYGLYYRAPAGIPYRYPGTSPGNPGKEPLLNLDGQDLPDFRFGTNRLETHRIVAIESGINSLVHTDISYSSITESSVYQAEQTGDSNDTYGSLDESQLFSVELDYTYSSKASRPVHVVSEIAQSDGIGGTNQFSYNYEGYKLHKLGYGSLGFSSVVKTETVSPTEKIITESHYIQETSDIYLLAGTLRSKSVHATDVASGVERKISESKLSWQVRDYGDDIDGAPSPHYFPYVLTEQTKNFDLSTGAWLNTISKRVLEDNFKQSCPSFSELTSNNRVINYDLRHDSYGTVINQTKNYCDAFGVTGKIRSNTNVSNLTSSWILGLVKDPIVRSWNYDSESNLLDEITQHTRYSFNSKGQITQQIIEPNAGEEIKLTNDYTYNSYGSVSTLTQTVGAFTNDGIVFTSRITTTNESFATNGVRTLITTNSLGHFITQKFNSAFGLEYDSTDISNWVTTTNYDIFGRPILTTYPDGTTTQNDYLECSSCFNYQSRTAWYIQEKTTGSTATKNYFDELNRELGGTNYGLNKDANYSYVQYDNRGNVDISVAPFRSDQTQQITDFDHDILNRLTQTKFPNLAVQSVVYAINSGARATTTTNTLGQSTERRFDALGREKSVTDALSTEVKYRYDALGNLSETEVKGSSDSSGIIHTIEYDLLGRKTQLNDPDVGTVSYYYNAFGFVSRQVNALNQETHFTYDKLGRELKRIDDATQSGYITRSHHWVYDTKPNGKGQLSSTSGYDTANQAYSEDYSYLDYGLLDQVNLVINGQTYFTKHTYDDFSRAVALTYPTGFTLINNYNSFGHIDEITSQNALQPYWTATTDDARGNITEYSYGNGVDTSKSFDYQLGLINTILAVKGGLTVQSHDYDFDSEGNLRKRADYIKNVTQRFCYDELDRLTHATFSSCSDVTNGNYGSSNYSYDPHGNMLTKDGITDYQYGSNTVRPHAVTFANGSNYIYDAAGQMKSGGGRTLDYSSYGKPTLMTKGNYNTEIIYGSNQTRIQRRDNNNGTIKTTTYVGKLYEKVVEGAQVKHNHYLGDFAVHVIDESTNNQYDVYYHRDHIGSIVSESSETIAAESDIKRMANEPWGRRQGISWDGLVYDVLTGTSLTNLISSTSRGFTDHEHLDSIGLIHMNGRVYDPIIGRFVSPDPWIQDSDNAQSFNRYSYVWNNPLRYTDPTGYNTLISDGEGEMDDTVPTKVISIGRNMITVAPTKPFKRRSGAGSMGATSVLVFGVGSSIGAEGMAAIVASAAEFVPLVVLGAVVSIGAHEIIESFFDDMLTRDLSGIAATPPPDDEDDIDFSKDYTGELTRKNPSATLRTALNTPKGSVAHHLIPTEFRTHQLIIRAARAGFNINGPRNGTNLLKSQHGWTKAHRQYNRIIRRQLDRALRKNPSMTNREASRFAHQMARRANNFVRKSPFKFKKR